MPSPYYLCIGLAEGDLKTPDCSLGDVVRGHARARERGARLEMSPLRLSLPRSSFLDATQRSPKRAGSVAWYPKNGWEGDYSRLHRLLECSSAVRFPRHSERKMFSQVTYWRKMASLARPFCSRASFFVAPSNVCHTGYTCSIYFSFSWELH